MINSVNEEMVLIKPDPIVEKTEGGLEMPEEAKARLVKAQNRGVVKAVGSKVTAWPKVDMYISFYRQAATDTPDNDEDFVLIHHSHCLVEFAKKK